MLINIQLQIKYTIIKKNVCTNIVIYCASHPHLPLHPLFYLSRHFENWNKLPTADLSDLCATGNHCTDPGGTPCSYLHNWPQGEDFSKPTFNRMDATSFCLSLISSRRCIPQYSTAGSFLIYLRARVSHAKFKSIDSAAKWMLYLFA
jgi:hypothetical protein